LCPPTHTSWSFAGTNPPTPPSQLVPLGCLLSAVLSLYSYLLGVQFYCTVPSLSLVRPPLLSPCPTELSLWGGGVHKGARLRENEMPGKMRSLPQPCQGKEIMGLFGRRCWVPYPNIYSHLFFLAVLGLELRALHLLGRCSTV
jgi:hypothetical protein